VVGMAVGMTIPKKVVKNVLILMMAVMRNAFFMLTRIIRMMRDIVIVMLMLTRMRMAITRTTLKNVLIMITTTGILAVIIMMA
jgi:hypothetical protein